MTTTGTPTTGAVTISYQPGAMFPMAGAQIQVTDGQFVLMHKAYLSFSGAFTFNALSISNNAVIFSNAPSTSVTGTVTLQVESSSTPSITATNFTGTVYINWPGGQQQELLPGNPMALTGW
jgi:hypothetical protein